MDEAKLLDAIQSFDAKDGARTRLVHNDIAPGEHIVTVEHEVPGESATAELTAVLAATGAGRIDLVNQYAPYWRV